MGSLTQTVVILGASGSVGRQAMAVLASMRDRFRVVGLSANDFALSRGIVQAVLATAAVLADPVDVDTDGDGICDAPGGLWPLIPLCCASGTIASDLCSLISNI